MKLTIGDRAPDFTTTNQNGTVIKLSSFKGKKVVLYFYPNDLTPGCTAEACSLRDNYKSLQKKGYAVLGVSTNDAKSHQKFISKENLPFDLLADTTRDIHEKYGTWVKKSMYGRTYMGTARITFLIDEEGRISEIIEKVDTKNHASQILGELKVKNLKRAEPTILKKTVSKGAVKNVTKSKTKKGK